MTNEQRKERISLARSRLLADCPFMGHLCLKLEIIFSDVVPTMGVTRDRKLYINPTFLDGLTDKEVVATLCHETLHPALLCFERQGGRLALVNGGISLWNVAHDYAINMIINDFGLTLPAGGLLDYKWKNQSAEEIYDKIIEDCEGQDDGEGQEGEGEGEEGEGEGEGQGEDDGDGDGDGQGGGQPKQGKGQRQGRQVKLPEGAWGHEDMLPDQAMTEAEKTNCDNQWKIAVVEADQVHRQRDRGNIPGQLQKIIKGILEPKVDWTDVLSRWVGENGRRADFTYSRPHRRSESVGEFLPSLKKHGCSDLIILWDTSGSMNGQEQRILSEVIGICDDMSMSLRVICCDTRVCSDVEDVDSPEDVDVKGGGGSNFIPAFDQLTDEGYEGVVVAFTDGYIGVPEVKPLHLTDCLWVIGPGDMDPTRGAWGEVLEVDGEGYAI